MAVLDVTHYALVWQDGLSEKTALYALRNVTAADTVDVTGQFSVVKRAVIIGTTLVGSGIVSTIAGTVITIPTGPASDAGYLLVYGCSS